MNNPHSNLGLVKTTQYSCLVNRQNESNIVRNYIILYYI